MSEYPHYPATFLMRQNDPATHRIIDQWRFRSAKSNKWYIVEMEHLSSNIIAVKFYYKGVRLSKQRYSLLTNDNEPRTIVYSCFELMNRYYTNDNTISFGFVAASDLDPIKKAKPGNRRFRFYRTLVNNYFGNQTFVHLQDGQERLYLLLNKQELKEGRISIDDIFDEINRIYEEDFYFSWD